MMKKKIICFDLDGVICITPKGNYKKSRPIKEVIKYINFLYNQGFYIKIFTARYMTRMKGNCKKIIKDKFKLTDKQLKKWKLNYHELIMCKPTYDLFIDDKSLGFNNTWLKNIKNFLKV